MATAKAGDGTEEHAEYVIFLLTTVVFSLLLPVTIVRSAVDFDLNSQRVFLLLNHGIKYLNIRFVPLMWTRHLKGPRLPVYCVDCKYSGKCVFINIHGTLSFCKHLCEQYLSESTYYT